MKSFHPKFTVNIVLTCLFLLMACSKDNDDLPIDTVFDFDPIETLADHHGDLTSEIAVVYAQGGPDVFLDPFEIDAVITSTKTEELLTINVHQGQTLDPTLINQVDISFDQAVAIDQQSVENLNEVISHLHDSGKKVYLVGTSFGGFLVQKYMADYGTASLTAILVVASRLNIQDGFWMGFSEGRTGRFEEGGLEWFLTDQNNALDRNISRLAAGVGKNRYIDLFASFSDLEKMTYVFSTKDDRIGTLDNAEKNFLISKRAHLIPIEGSHSETVVSGIVRGYEEGLMIGN